MRNDYDFAVLGGGLVGAATAYGLAKLGLKVLMLDEGDVAKRASGGNFALVWVQNKGLGTTPRSSPPSCSCPSRKAWPTAASCGPIRRRPAARRVCGKSGRSGRP